MYIRVQVTPSAKRERFEIVSEDTCAVSVKEPALRNLANKRVVFLVAHHFSVPQKSVRIVSGHRSKRKILSVDKEEK